MMKLADLIEKNGDELATLESINMGVPAYLFKAAFVSASAKYLRYYAGWCDKISGKTISIPGPYQCYTRREPVGVCG